MKKKHPPSRPVASGKHPPSRRVAAGKYRPQPGDPRYGRSRITNGALLPDVVDGRSPWVRRAKDIIGEHIADLGGIDNVSAAERSIIRRAATLTIELEMLETRFALAGQAAPNDLDLYQRTAGNLRRLLESVGLRRRARVVRSPLEELWRESGALLPTAEEIEEAEND